MGLDKLLSSQTCLPCFDVVDLLPATVVLPLLSVGSGLAYKY